MNLIELAAREVETADLSCSLLEAGRGMADLALEGELLHERAVKKQTR